MANKYLDETGLSYFWGKVKAFFAPDTNPLAPGTADKGSSSKFARQDHVHPAQTSVSGNAGTATKLAVANQIDGLAFDGSSAIVHYATCSIAAGTAAKTASFPTGVNPGYSLTTGLRVAVKFSYANTANNPTLNVASLGAKNIYHNGAQITTGSNKALLAGTVEFVYDGANWQLVGNYVNSTYTAASATPLMDASTAAVGTSAKYAREDHVHPSDSTKVDKVDGKGLSTNDYTTAEQTKLAGIASGAEVNQNAFSTLSALAAGGTSIGSVSASSKTATMKLKEGANIDLVFDDDDSLLIAIQNSPTLTGSPTANTPAAGTNNGQIATTAFVATAIANAQVGAASFQGTVSANSTISNSSYKKGWYWVVATAGTYVGETCEVGDMIFAIKDKGSAYSASDFSVIQSNLDLVAITNGEIDNIVA